MLETVLNLSRMIKIILDGSCSTPKKLLPSLLRISQEDIPCCEEARCRALLKEQQKQYNASPVDLNTMKLLEKSTRTLWVSKISELITEKRAEEYCKLYGDVLGVNIVEDEGKRCGNFLDL